MIDQARIADKLRARFGRISEVRPGVLRASEVYENREYAVWYFDLTNNIREAASHLREYQEDLMAETFFGTKSPADLRWNHYLYFVAGDEAATAPAFHDAKMRIEADRTYARKTVFTEKELDVHFAAAEKAPATPLVDISSQWSQRLDALGLSFILNDSVTAPEAARMIKAGLKQSVTRSAAQASLSEAEKTAGSRFLKSLSITGFRKCPSAKHFEFGGVNLIIGRNGTGKTSLLEAIEYLYCGENRRHNDILPDTKIIGNFEGSNAPLTTSTSSTKSVVLRTRNSHWYAKADVKKSTLASSFGKFNFLDTDAAVDLSNNNNSEDRLKSDVARLLLGAEAEQLATKLTRVAEKIDIAIRDTEKDTDNIRRRITEAGVRLDTIRKAPQTSDALYINLRDALFKCKWKNIPATKQDATKLSDPLQASVVAARQLTHAASNDRNADSVSLIIRRSSLESALTSAEKISDHIKNLIHTHTAEHQAGTSLRSKQLSIEALLRYCSVGFTDMFSHLATLRTRVNSSGARLAVLGNVLVDLGEMLEADIRLNEVLASSDETVHQLEIIVGEQTTAIKIIEATMASVNVLRQRLISTANELLSKLADPDHCPVCRTQFEAGKLKLQMTLTAENGGSEPLAEAQTKLKEAADKLAQAKTLQSAYKALIVFVAPQADLSVRQAQRIVKETSALVEQDRRDIEELERVISQLASDGLTEADLHKHLADLGLDSMPNAEELGTIQADCSKTLAKYTKANEVREKELAKLRQRLINFSDMPAMSLDASPEAQVQHMRVRLADLNLLISAVQQLESVLDRLSGDDAPLELRLGQASDQFTRLVTALQTETHADSTILTEVQNIATLETHLLEYTEQLARMRAASGLIEELLQQAKAGVFADQVLKANAASIAAIFSAIQAPNEFIVQADNEGSLKITREDTNVSVALQQMSTGQRAAYALSLFLSMNNSLISGPPLVLLDDPIAHVDDLNILSFIDYLREIAIRGSRQIFLATADDKLAGLFRQKFRFMGPEKFREFLLSR